MASRNIEDCSEKVQELYWQFCEAMDDAGLEAFALTCTLRSDWEQLALWCQGRYPLEVTNHVRTLCGLAPITEEQNKRKVTWTLKSRHRPNKQGKSEAFDIVLLKPEAHWDLKADVDEYGIPDYGEAGRVGERVGLKWGGRFSTPDYCHFEAP